MQRQAGERAVTIDNAINLGRTLAMLRIWRGRTQGQVANAVGFSVGRINKMERHGMFLTEETLASVCRALEVTPGTLRKLENCIRMELLP